MRPRKNFKATIFYLQGLAPRRLKGSTMEEKIVTTNRAVRLIHDFNRSAGMASLTMVKVARILVLALFLASCQLPKRIPSFQENASLRVQLIGWELIHKPAGRIRLDLLVQETGDTIHFLTIRPRYPLRTGLKYRFGYDSATFRLSCDTLRGSLKLLNL